MNAPTANATRAVHDFAEAERVHKIAVVLRDMRPSPYHSATTAMNATRAKHPRVLAVLEQTTEAIHQGVEAQMGESIRTMTLGKKTTWEPTEVGFWRAAWESADKGEVDPTFMWFYTAAAYVAGVCPFDDRTTTAVKRYLGE